MLYIYIYTLQTLQINYIYKLHINYFNSVKL